MILPPKGPTRSSSDNSLALGTIVTYENDGTLLLAVILDHKKDRFLLLNHREREVELPSLRIYSLQTKLPGNVSTRIDKHNYLTNLLKTAEELSQRISLEEIWSLIVDEGKEYSCEELCRQYYGNLDLEKHLALRIAVLADKIYFKRKKEDFLPRPVEVIDELKLAEQARLRKIELQNKLLNFFQQKRNNQALELPHEADEIIELIKQIAAEGGDLDGPKHKEARDFLSLCAETLGIALTGKSHERAYHFLRAVNIFSANTNLALIRHDIPVKFPASLVSEAPSLLSREPLFELSRKDYSSLRTITIDDSSTKDMDDALSLEFRPGGYLLGIHISDVASFIACNSPLDLEAQRRATSLYICDQTIHMLPEALSEDALSLRQDQKRASISYFFEISHDYSILRFYIEPSWVVVKERLNYEQVNELCENGGPEWEVLHGIAATNESRRLENGGMRISKRDSLPVIDSNNKITLQEIDEDSPGRSLVGELMVLANEFAANFALENKIPHIFRGQESPDPGYEKKLLNIPEGIARDYHARYGLKKSYTGLTPYPHATLGVKAYCQVTSPIRRYADLLNQRQLLSFLSIGKPMYAESELETIIEKTSQRLSAATYAARESKRFWLLKFLEQEYLRKGSLTGTVVRTDLKTPYVELDQVYFSVPVKLRSTPTLGQKVKVRLTAIDPAFDYVRFEEA